MAPAPLPAPANAAAAGEESGREDKHYTGPTRCRTFRTTNDNKCKVVISVGMPLFRHVNLASAYSDMVGDVVKYRHLHIIGLPQNVRAEQPAARSDWLLRLHTDADSANWDAACQHLAAVYVQSQVFSQLGGYISALTASGWHQWTIGTPPSWHGISGKTSFSKLDMSRTGDDQGNACYYYFHAAAMQLAFPGRVGLVPAIDASTNTPRSVGNVVETVLGICTALVNDCIILSAPKRFSAFLSPDEYFTGMAEALCNFAIHTYRLGADFEYSTMQPRVYAQSYLDAAGNCVTPADGYKNIIAGSERGHTATMQFRADADALGRHEGDNRAGMQERQGDAINEANSSAQAEAVSILKQNEDQARMRERQPGAGAEQANRNPTARPSSDKATDAHVLLARENAGAEQANRNATASSSSDNATDAQGFLGREKAAANSLYSECVVKNEWWEYAAKSFQVCPALGIQDHEAVTGSAADITALPLVHFRGMGGHAAFPPATTLAWRLATFTSKPWATTCQQKSWRGCAFVWVMQR